MRNKNFLHGLRQLWRNSEGVTALEFGLLAPVFFLLFLGLLEVCMIMTKIVLSENAIRIAGRTAIVASNTKEQIQDIITRNTFGLVDFQDSERNCVVISAYTTVAAFKDRPKSSGCADANKNLGDTDIDKPDVYLIYELFMEHRFFTPMGALMNLASRTTSAKEFKSIKFSTSTVVKNEPFADPDETPKAPTP
jgi:Flp pilus assembly pilin Flp